MRYRQSATRWWKGTFGTGAGRAGRLRPLRLPAAVLVSALLGSAIAHAAGGLSADSLDVDGFNYETELKALFLGDFDNSRLKPDDMRFSVLLSGYINGFSRQCEAYLPKDAVEITESRCVEESTPVNIYGNPVGATTCSRYESFGTGRYADPELMSLSSQLESQLVPGMLSDAFGLSGRDPLESPRQMADVALSFGDDMTALFQRNACGGEGIKRLQANIERFAQGQPPLRLASGATLASSRAQTGAGGPFVDSDYAKLVDALITENAQGWMLNRYVLGSASGVSVLSRDSDGRPAQLRANYQFDTFGNRSAGSVLLSFKDGLPDCLYFADAPQVCRLPSRRIITAYEKGEYR